MTATQLSALQAEIKANSQKQKVTVSELKNFVETEGIEYARKESGGITYKLSYSLLGNFIVAANNHILYRGTDVKKATKIYNNK